MVCAAAIGVFGEDQDSGRDARIGPEDAGGQLDDGIELVLLDQNLLQLLMRL